MKNESGRSMIEMLGVLAIIGVLSVGGIAGYSKAMEKFKINKTINQISHIVANTRILFMGQKNYAGLDAGIAHDTGIIQDEMWSSTDDKAYNIYGGKVEIAESFIHMSDDGWETRGVFLLGFENISKEACIALALYDWRQLHPDMYIVGEWNTLDELMFGYLDDALRQGITELDKDDLKREKIWAKNNYGWYINFLDFEPLSPADASAACDNTYDDSNLYQIVFAFH